MAKGTEMLAQAQKVWSNLGLGQKVAIVGITIAVFGGILMTTFLASQPDYKILRSNVAAKDLGAIKAQLDGLGISEYKIVDDGRTVLVEAGEYDRANNQLYEAGVVSSSTEEPDDLGLLGVSGLTGNAEKYHYLRRDERRLAEMIRGIEQVEAAKVTITRRLTRYFKVGDQNAKAAVIVKTRNGYWNRDLSDSIAMIVSGGVEGLSPDDVSITANGQLARRPGRKGDLGLADEDQVAIQAKIEEEKEFKAQEALNLVTGPGKVVVRVAVDMDWTRQQISEKAYDPEGVRTEKSLTESVKETPAIAGGNASGQATQNGGNSAGGNGFRNKVTTERSEYGVTEKQMVKVGPELKRMTVAILIDESLAEKKAEVEKIVAAAIGLDASRGDEISTMIHTFAELPATEFETGEPSGSPAAGLITWIERGVWALVGLIFLFFALRTVKKAQAGLRDVLQASLEEEAPIEPPKPITLEETVLETAMQDTELAGRSLRRWLYEGATEAS